MTKMTVFEKLSFISLPIAAGYLAMGYEVGYFDKNVSSAFSVLYGYFHRTGKIKKMPPEDFTLAMQYEAHNAALDIVESAYEVRFSKSGAIRLMARMMGSDLVHSIYKKALLARIYDYYRMQSVLNKMAVDAGPGSWLCFVACDYMVMEKMTAFGKPRGGLDKRFFISWWSRILSLAAGMGGYIANIFCLFAFPVWISAKVKKVDRDKPLVKDYQAGIRVYQGDFGMCGKYRSMDFILDGRDLNASNVLFCAETYLSGDYVSEIRKRGYSLVVLPEILCRVSRAFLKEKVFKVFLPFWAQSMAASLTESGFITKTTVTILRDYLLWSRFLDEFRIKHYAVYNNYERGHITRNILLSKRDVTTWYYIHSGHNPDLFNAPDEPDYRHTFFSYMYYDRFLSWGGRVTRYYSSFITHIGKFENSGCLWSEHVRKAAEDKELYSSKRRSILKSLGRDSGRIVAVFDTTVGADAPLQLEDMAAFVTGIVRLMDEDPDIVVVFKEKWLWNELLEREPGIASYYQKLYEHARCYRTGGSNRDSTEVMAVSDLVISAPFTAPTTEALGARKKAIYFDATNRFRGRFYDTFPKLVAHNYNELKGLVRYWLDEASDKDFSDYLDRHIKGKIDAYVDGRGITRFRAFLCGKEEAAKHGEDSYAHIGSF
ncbi:MAG: polysaccharide biosynthesis PFTS motif protein [Candidatus Omnitrophica bacterium]|nr:polysaccharide biosynthesis PFTS motif protein [Candidatus Omnitrophota bacterium]